MSLPMTLCLRCHGHPEPCMVCDGKGTVTKETLARNVAVHKLARELAKDGDLELDDEGRVVTSEGEDNGCYVMMWKWVSFEGTSLDKQAKL